MIPLLLFLGFTIHAPVPPDKAVRDATRALRGEWVVTRSEEFGRAGELHVGDVLKFDGEQLTHVGRGGLLKYRISLGPKAKPSRIDWRPATPKDAAWSHRGIYKLKGKQLTVCIVVRFERDDDKDRPSEFRTKAGRKKRDAAGSVLLILKRKKR